MLNKALLLSNKKDSKVNLTLTIVDDGCDSDIVSVYKPLNPNDLDIAPRYSPDKWANGYEVVCVFENWLGGQETKNLVLEPGDYVVIGNDSGDGAAYVFDNYLQISNWITEEEFPYLIDCVSGSNGGAHFRFEAGKTYDILVSIWDD